MDASTSKLDGSPDILGGSNDWAQLLLNQAGARRSPGALFVVDGRLVGNRTSPQP